MIVVAIKTDADVQPSAGVRPTKHAQVCVAEHEATNRAKPQTLN